MREREISVHAFICPSVGARVAGMGESRVPQLDRWRAAIGGKVAECNVTWYGALTCHVMVIVCLYGATCNVMLWGSAKQGRVGQGARPTQLIMAQAMHLDPRRWRCSQCFRRA